MTLSPTKSWKCCRSGRRGRHTEVLSNAKSRRNTDGVFLRAGEETPTKNTEIIHQLLHAAIHQPQD
ncbi:uncharacterized, partial [Tachysurus ichikawai]